jgi:hypothetical protein
MSVDVQPQSNPHSPGQHLATVSHEGRFWDVYLEFVEDPRYRDTHRARLVFSPADAEADESLVRTATIIIEPSFEEANRRARELPDHQLVALLRSTLPERD